MGKVVVERRKYRVRRVRMSICGCLCMVSRHHNYRVAGQRRSPSTKVFGSLINLLLAFLQLKSCKNGEKLARPRWVSSFTNITKASDGQWAWDRRNNWSRLSLCVGRGLPLAAPPPTSTLKRPRMLKKDSSSGDYKRAISEKSWQFWNLVRLSIQENQWESDSSVVFGFTVNKLKWQPRQRRLETERKISCSISGNNLLFIRIVFHHFPFCLCRVKRGGKRAERTFEKILTWLTRTFSWRN